MSFSASGTRTVYWWYTGTVSGCSRGVTTPGTTDDNGQVGLEVPSRSVTECWVRVVGETVWTQIPCRVHQPPGATEPQAFGAALAALPLVWRLTRRRGA